MGLSQQQQRELDAFIEAVVDETISPADAARLQQMLREDPAAQQHYVRSMRLHASLYAYADAGTTTAPTKKGRLRPSAAKVVQFFTRPTPFSMTVATIVIGLLLTAMAFMAAPFYRAIIRNDDEDSPGQYDIIAEVTDLRDVKWTDPNRSAHRGAYLVAGRRLRLDKGLTEITYRSGARVILEGPAVYEVRGANDGYLESGKLVARITRTTAQGFAVETPVARVEDVGTEFGVQVREGGTTEVVVLSGVVDMIRRDEQDRLGHRVRLTESEAAIARRSDVHVARLESADDLSSKFVTSIPTPSGRSEVATVTWNKLRPITANTNIANPKRVVQAWNFGNASSSIDVDVAGTKVTFSPISLPFSGTDARPNFFDARNTSVGADFESVLDSFAYNDPPGGDPNPKVLSFDNLTDGGKYTLQVFTSDDRPRTWYMELEIAGVRTLLYTGGQASASNYVTATVDLEPGVTRFDLVMRGLANGPEGPSGNGNELVVINAVALAEVTPSRADRAAELDVP